MAEPVSDHLFDRFKVIDVDTHLTEPPDVWTSRLPAKYGDMIPHMERMGRKDMWMINGKAAGAPGAYTMAGHDGIFPESYRDTWDELPASAYDPAERLKLMDDEGIHAQVLYPNVGGFGSGRFLRLPDEELKLACVRAYNDFVIEWTNEDPNRLVPVMGTPFWDVDETVREIERCAKLGAKSVLFCNAPEAFDLPPTRHPRWDPIWAAAQDADIPVAFHIGGGDDSGLFKDTADIGFQANFGRVSSLMVLDNIRTLADLIFGGICHRFPKLKFVSVESGVGWIQGVLETFDWQWSNGGVRNENPEYDLLPSEYFKRQIYGCFWFENHGIKPALEIFPDNILYETDYPHPTCQYPNPQTPAQHPRDYADQVLSDLPETTLQKIFHDNAAALYKLG